MVRWILCLLTCTILASPAGAADETFAAIADLDALREAAPALARELLVAYRDNDRETDLDHRFRLQLLGRRYDEALESLTSLQALRDERSDDRRRLALLPYAVYARAKVRAASGATLEEAFAAELLGAFESLDDRTAFEAEGWFEYNLPLGRRRLAEALELHPAGERMRLDEALDLMRQALPYLVYPEILPLSETALVAETERRYEVRDDLTIETPEGATLSAVVVRPRRFSSPEPAALLFNIYSAPRVNVQVAKQAAAHGFVGVVADARGKARSPDPIEPFEHEASDVRAVIDWISRQPWSNRAVGMFGGSYNAFAQWAATKRLHPALKTIVPAAASLPGLAWPMQNNVFLNANYCWTFQVTNAKTDDPSVCREAERWDSMVEAWYASGRPYRQIDKVDGTPNPLLQRWLEHPDYDEYWQSMVPHGADFAEIDIPVLTVTGYWDDNQPAALHYLREHQRHRPDAEHALLIGPWDHLGAQFQSPPVVRGYRIDPVASVNVPELIFGWLRHVLRGQPRPALLRDEVNVQVMGTNEWRHAPSIAALSNDELALYLVGVEAGDRHRLSTSPPGSPGTLVQEVDLADRTKHHNQASYPDPVVREELEAGDGLVFVSDPFEEPIEIVGALEGELRVAIDRRDFDFGVTLFELLPDGRYLHLSYVLQRASYAWDPSSRRPLRPGEVTSIPIRRSSMIARRLAKGSRLVAVVDVNVNPGAQVNYGTGGDVSDESIDQAGAPLRVQWHEDSRILLPITRPAPPG